MPDTNKAQLQKAYNLIKAKKKAEANKLLVSILKTEQNNAAAWWLLAHTIDDNTAKQRQALEQVIRIQPNHQAAQSKLDKLNQKTDPQQLPGQSPKPNAQAVEQQSPKKFGCFGIAAVLIAGFFLLSLVLCGGGYYTLFYTSFLLGRIESLVESDGNVKLEGFTGAISSGFHVDRILIRVKEDKWSSLEQIDFQFNGISDVFNNERVLIQLFRVGSGTIYHHSFTETNESSGSQESPDNTGTAESERSTSGGNESAIEFQITEFVLSNLKFINLDTGAESKVDKLSIVDFHYKDGAIANLGEFQIVDLSTRSQEFELVNLTGSTSNGFHVDRFRSQDLYGNWSHLDEIDFQFNGLKDLIDHNRLVISRLSVGDGGELYIPWNDEDKQDSNRPDETNQTGQDSQSLNEVRVDLLLIPNLKFINPETGIELKIDEISVKNYHYQAGQIKTLGDIVVNAGDIEFKTAPSDYFANQAAGSIKQQFSGVIGSPIHESILADISFDIHTAFMPDDKTLVYANFFDKKLTYTVNEQQDTTLTFQQFSPSNYILWQHGPLPVNLTGEFRTHKDSATEQKTVVTISPDSHFQLGQLTFDIETTELSLTESEDVSPRIEAKHQAAGGEYWCWLSMLPDEPYLKIELLFGDEKNTPDLFAQVFYNTSYNELSENDKQAIARMLQNTEAAR